LQQNSFNHVTFGYNAGWLVFVNYDKASDVVSVHEFSCCSSGGYSFNSYDVCYHHVSNF